MTMDLTKIITLRQIGELLVQITCPSGKQRTSTMGSNSALLLHIFLSTLPIIAIDLHIPAMRHVFNPKPELASSQKCSAGQTGVASTISVALRSNRQVSEGSERLTSDPPINVPSSVITSSSVPLLTTASHVSPAMETYRENGGRVAELRVERI
jgi:hypothetical protein